MITAINETDRRRDRFSRDEILLPREDRDFSSYFFPLARYLFRRPAIRELFADII